MKSSQSRRNFLRYIGIGGCTAFVSSGNIIAGTKRGGSKPNILLITADDMHWDTVGVYKGPVKGVTPNLDKLAGDGIMFKHGYIQISICGPSRHVMLTGNHSHQTMTRCFTDVKRVGPPLPDLLKKNGYYLGIIHKLSEVYPWDYRKKENKSKGRNVKAYRTDITKMIKQAKSRNKPFFIMANTNDPHRHFYGAEKYKELRDQGKVSQPSRVYTSEEIKVPGFLPDLPEIREEVANYYSSARRSDDAVGEILKTIDDHNLTDNTIVLFLSDNGMSMPFSKINCYRESLRIPLLVRWPGKIKPGAVVEKQMVSAVDIAPTLLEMVDIPVPNHMVGKSFYSILQGGTQKNRDHVVGYYYRNLNQTNMFPTFTVLTTDTAYIYNPWSNGRKKVHNSDYTRSTTLKAMWEKAKKDKKIRKRTEFHKYRVIEEFYNHASDPYGYENQINNKDYKKQIDKFKKILLEWMIKTKHPATDLMRDPMNKDKIDKYMSFEKRTARKQVTDKRKRKRGK